ncbi:MAG: acetyl-CoA hydrolase/transferase C-terminal domain-containing protein [Actinomycetota bacterium]|nr:acetyl-CoA hydrolase/transferase C-terminal domain-containing protein [Actinomycetota bacterium]
MRNERYVASEYGVVNLEGKSLRGRGQALIGIAHPDLRGELRRYARKVKYFVLSGHDPFED